MNDRSGIKKTAATHHEWGSPDCTFPPHDFLEHPCGQPVIPGITRCPHCGNLDGSEECAAAGCWVPATQADLDALICEGMERRLDGGEERA